MGITITESDMEFGPFNESHVCQIEDSAFLKGIKGLKKVEFMLLSDRQAGTLQYLEAKSSVAHFKNSEDFEKNILDVLGKFRDSHHMLMSLLMKRHDEWETLPPLFLETPHDKLQFRFFLVIKGHKPEWCLSVMDVLKSRMSTFCNIWNIHVKNIKVINEAEAKRLELVERP